VIAAAGSGQRLGAGGPKAFVPVAGRPLVEWSLAAFRAAPSVGPIVIACPPGHAPDLAGDGDGVVVVEGGATRAESVSNALAVVETELVAVHDAARPCVTDDLIEDVIAALVADPEAAAAIAAAPVTDTIKRVEIAGSESQCNAFRRSEGRKALQCVERTLDRRRLWAAQTPQVFRVGALREALAADAEAIAAATDEAMILEATGGKVLIHPSPPENLKVTRPFDLRVAELLLRQ
jgi:2-C-methyl-D-erythritol 4-phosphate cytidylyltransferase